MPDGALSSVLVELTIRSFAETRCFLKTLVFSSSGISARFPLPLPRGVDALELAGSR